MAAICVFCSSSEDIDPTYVELAAEVGTELATRRHTVVSGGGSLSCMGALARAARDAGGATIGVIPRFLASSEIADHHADELIVTETMGQRKAVMAARSDGFVILPGGLGTLEELFEMWVGRTLGVHDKPVVICDPDGLFDPLRQQLTVLVERRFARQSAIETLTWTTSAAAAVDAVERRLVEVRPAG